MEEQELLKLIDKYIDESLTLEETEEFNDLLECSKDFRNLFRQRIKLHGDLVSHYEAQDIPGITPFEKPQEKTSQLLHWSLLVATAAVIIFALVFKGQQPASQNNQLLAKVTHDEQALLKIGERAISPGNFLGLKKGSYKLLKGMIELAMRNDVDLAIEAPAYFSIDSNKRISLKSGKLSANVGEAGRGFEVITPDGKIIDLGTRFGVSVSEKGNSEAHVFEGKINVIANNQSTEITENIAVSFSKGVSPSKFIADQSSFPLPGFPLEVETSNLNFEENNFFVGWPKTAALWGGDHCERVQRTNDIIPVSGRSMLQFVKPYAKGAADENQNVSQLWQIIDLKEYRDEVNRGGVRARLTAFFNTVENLSVTDNSFSISLNAFNGEISQIKNYWDQKRDPFSELLGSSSHKLRTDLNSTTWEKSETSLQIPAGTDFLLIQLAVDSGKNRKLEGHFADNISFEIATEPRRSIPVSDWTGKAGKWSDKSKWKSGELPKEQDTIRIMGPGEVTVESELTLKQPLILATHNNSEGYLRISPSGVLGQSANGEMLIGYNEGGVATVLVEGTLRNHGRVFIGRNNLKSSLIVDGGTWDAAGAQVRMSQYGLRGEDTQSLLEIKNGGKVHVKSLEMIHDNSVVELVDGYLEVETLVIGGDNGTAIINHHSGILRTDSLTFGTVDSRYYIAGVEAQLWLKGEWTVEKLLNIQNSLWVFQGEEIKKEQLQVSQKDFEGKTYSVFKLK
ncbi:MAG: FecR family protein [Lentisphaeraceae bacterium]|nr:FecR family protein [Lentisphaeraceae bacterium]